jgi:tRNA modification GTPase
MLSQRADPIVAVATAAGRGAVGIVRVSGTGLAALLPGLLARAPRPREAAYGPFLAADGSVLDRGLALWFPAPHSYTGEDVLELQAHGGPVLLQLLLARCLEAAATIDGLRTMRLARPGEFTERAYLNGKLDLAQAEAVADLIDAGTEAAARSAGRALAGEFSQRVHALAQALIRLRSLVEATLDFPEEEIDFLQAADATGQLAALREGLRALQAQARQGSLLSEGLRVVLAGQPNVGKSSLLNALAGAELAIVTPLPGTTRDRIEQGIQIEGVPLHLVDTAGLRDARAASPGAPEGEPVDAGQAMLAPDEVERIGIGRSWQAIESADLVLWLHDLTRRGEPAYESAEAAIAQRLPPAAKVLHVHNKCDLKPPACAPEAGIRPDTRAGLEISAAQGIGLPALRQALLQAAGWQAATAEGVFSARSRHVQALAQAAGHLEGAAEQLEASTPALELLAEELRSAHEALGRIVGHMTADELLGEIFGRFCIGK